MIVIGQLLMVAVQSHELISKRPQTISELQTEYLSNEEKLWHRIDQLFGDLANIDEIDVKETTIDALKIHRTIFFDNTFETNSYWRSYLLFRIGNFRDYLSNINDTLEENYRYLYDGAEHLNYHAADIELWTRDTMFHRLKENNDGLFNLTVNQKDAIFEQIQTVSEQPKRTTNA